MKHNSGVIWWIHCNPQISNRRLLSPTLWALHGVNLRRDAERFPSYCRSGSTWRGAVRPDELLRMADTGDCDWEVWTICPFLKMHNRPEIGDKLYLHITITSRLTSSTAQAFQGVEDVRLRVQHTRVPSPMTPMPSGAPGAGRPAYAQLVEVMKYLTI